MSILVYLLLLPAAVWLLGATFSLLDHADRARTLSRIAWRGLPFVAAALLLGARAAAPALAAIATVLIAHLIWCWLVSTILWRRRPPDTEQD